MPVAVPSCNRLYYKGWYKTPGDGRATFHWFKTTNYDNLNPMDALLGESGQDFRIEEAPVNGFVNELANDCVNVDYQDVQVYTMYSEADLTVRSVYPLDCKWYVEPGVYVADLYPTVAVHYWQLWKYSLEARYPGYRVVDYHHAVVPPAVWQRYRSIKEQYGEDYHINVHFRPLIVWAKERTRRCGVQWYVSGVYRTGLGGLIDQVVQDVPEAAPQHSLPEGVQLAQPGTLAEEYVPSPELIVPEESVPTTEVQEDPDHVSDSSDSDVPQEEEAWHASDADEDPVWVAMVGAMDALVPPVPPVPEIEVIDLMDTTTDEEDEFMVLPMEDSLTPPSTPPRGTGTRPNPDSE